MSESFVDLTYRGLQLGRRVKLAQVRPSTGYLEMPAPMPVGTAIAVTTDDGIAFDAVVNGIHEQTGGNDKPPGMTIKPKLANEAATTWWQARVSLPDLEPPVVRERKRTEKQPKLEKPVEAPAAPVTKPYAAQQPIEPATHPEAAFTPPAAEPMSDADVMAAASAMAAIPQGEIAPSRSRPVTLRPQSQGPASPDRAAARSDAEVRSKTQANEDAPTTIGAPLAIVDEHSIPELVDDGKKTQVMDSIDPSLLEQLVAGRQSQPAIEDDAPRTTAMDAVDLAALGLDVASKSGQMAAVPAATDDEPSDATDESKPASRNSSTSVRRRRNPKKR